MKILYFDLVGGIAGDMTVAALIELGVPLDALRDALHAVGLTGVELATERAQRHAIAGTRFLVRDVTVGASLAHGHEHGHEHAHGHERGHGHEHEHEHAHAHEHAHEHGHEQGHPHRAYREIKAMIEGSALAPGAKTRALAVFARLAEAEGAVHGVPAEQVTFHEVGAWDSIADVVCTAVGLEYLAPDALYCSAVPLGAGSVWSAHGRMPVPAPATLRLLEGFPVVQGGPSYERTTPTGAAILAALVRPAPEPLRYVPQRVGIGIGSMDSPEVPNLLRLVLAQDAAPAAAPGGAAGASGTAAGEAGREPIECAMANLDDASGEWIAYLAERLFTAGALDVALVPVQMKKGRPGTQVQVLYAPDLREAVLAVLFAESTTLGVRYHTLERAVLRREAATVETPYGAIAGKVAHIEGRRRFAPEYEACRVAALAQGVPLQEVYRAAERAWASGQGTSGQE